MKTENATGYMRRERAAEFCGVSVRTISDWQRTHLVPFCKVSRRVVLFKVADLEKALDRFTVKSNAAEA